MRTLAEAWASLAQAVLPEDCSPVQRCEMRRAFYAGARAFLSTMSEACASDDVSVAQGAARIEALSRELDAFVEDMRTGKA